MSMSLLRHERCDSGGYAEQTFGYRSRFLRHISLASANMSHPNMPSMICSVALNLATSSRSTPSRYVPAVTASL